MSLSSRITKAVYVPDGVQTLYVVPFPLFSERDVECWSVNETGLATAITDFTVEGYGSQNGVHVRFAVAPAAGGSLVVRRNTRQVQESAYPEGGKFPSLVVENDLDRIVGMIQELDEAVDRSLKVNVSEEKPSESAEELYIRINGIAADAEAAVGISQSNAASANQSAINAAASKTAAAKSAGEAEDNAELARRWAENPEGAPVIDEHYSAYHWAKKALENASNGLNLSDALDGTRKAADGVGASEWALAQAMEAAAAAQGAAVAAQGTAAAALPAALYEAHHTYSFEEFDTGQKWVDGSPIYAKTLDCGHLPNVTQKMVPTNIEKLKRVLYLKGIIYSEGVPHFFQPLPYYNGPYWFSLYSMGGDGSGPYVVINTPNDGSPYKAFVTLYYIKTE